MENLPPDRGVRSIALARPQKTLVMRELLTWSDGEDAGVIKALLSSHAWVVRASFSIIHLLRERAVGIIIASKLNF